MTVSADLLGMPSPLLADWLDSLGVPRAHTGRVFRSLHRKRMPLDAVPDLGRHAAIVEAAGWRAQARVVESVPAPRNVERLVFALADGARVEGVVLPHRERPDRVTLCLSSQVGCAMGCRFCATGTLGLTRSLKAGEIVAQVHSVRDRLEGSGRSLTHLVFMGMGEPLHAYGAVRDALHVLFDPHGVPFDRKKVTVSTVGLVSRLHDLLQDFDGRIQLALSLHAGTDATRRAIIPTARASSLSDLKAAARQYEERARRRTLVEYVVLPGVNDSASELAGLAGFMKGLRGIVNLIPFNPFSTAPYRPPTEDEVRSVFAQLRAHGVPVSVRWPRGRDAHGACGQLMLAGVPTPAPAS